MTLKIYTTMQGDAWDAIAYRLWGREFLFRELVAANPEHLDMLVFPAGVKLKVPELSAEAVKQSELPPWRK